jgi:beta-N-acetylhexosaminidase
MSLGPLMVDVVGTALTREDREMLAHPLVGSVILFTRNYADPEQLQRLVQDIHAVRSPPLLVAVDHEGGRVQRFRPGFSALPALRRIGHLYDLDAGQGMETARRLGWLRIDHALGPDADVAAPPPR